MRVIGVVDLRAGRAVHARGGVRNRYVPVDAVAGCPIDGDPLALAHAYADRFGLTELYVADLDAIVEDTPQEAVIASLAALGIHLYVDAGVSAIDRAGRLVALGVNQVVVGLETLPSYASLRTVCDAFGGSRIAFSLDLRHGEPVVARDGLLHAEAPDRIAARAVDAGTETIIVLDLGRVGTGAGLDIETIISVRRAVPGVTLLAGGGVHGRDDLARLADTGCDGVLVATALHRGLIGPGDIEAAARL
jgi:phosphoribosylformimino-5-aminoimidazole carboxamide ribotide isomerase